jgi:hypothetical protein
MNHRVPQHTTDLRIDADTTHEEVIDFLDARLSEPAVLSEGSVVVWNFNSHDLDANALLRAGLDDGQYVVPYQVPGVWGFMVSVLPLPLSNATLLTYRRGQGEYATYPNLRSPPEGSARNYREKQQSKLVASFHDAVDGLGGEAYV